MCLPITNIPAWSKQIVNIESAALVVSLVWVWLDESSCVKVTRMTQSGSGTSQQPSCSSSALSLFRYVSFFFLLLHLCARREHLRFDLWCHKILPQPCKARHGCFYWISKLVFNFQRLLLQTETFKLRTWTCEFSHFASVCYLALLKIQVEPPPPFCCAYIKPLYALMKENEIRIIKHSA